ncbi:MAG: hypothetical protein ACI4JT_03515 [Oscillospiraceae bacterium]
MNNNLEKIQKVFGVFKILSRVFMIICFVAAGLALVSVVLTLAGGENTPIMKIGGVSIYLPVFFETNETALGSEKACWVMAAGFVAAACEGILLAFANRYFTIEQKEGTPFTENGAKLTLDLGITAIVLSVVSSGIQSSIYSVMKISEISKDLSNEWGVLLGVALILFSLIIRYGADLEKNREKEKLE